MSKRLADRPVLAAGMAVLVAFFAFLAVKWFLTHAPESSALAVPTVMETAAARTARIGHEQTAKDWQAAQERSHARRPAAVGADSHR